MIAAIAPSDISLFWSLPFVALLLCIAIWPVVNHHAWERFYPWVALALGLVPAVYYLLPGGQTARWVYEMKEYVGFILLLAALYIVSGGILLTLTAQATPAVNVTLLLCGALLANVLGTTGAAILLIRPFLRLNHGHVKPYHVVFFIFIVANVGGCLTPIGDPPLFLGYLAGVPFGWVFHNLWPMWAFACTVLLIIFYFIDTWEHRRQTRHMPSQADAPIVIRGLPNLLFIGLIIMGVFQMSIMVQLPLLWQNPSGALALKVLLSREVLMLAAIVLSLRTTPPSLRKENQFTYGPIREVAILFAGIFSTMTPALHWLDFHAGSLPLKTPGQHYFTSGVLSSFLDNAPTYMTFLRLELNKLAMGPEGIRTLVSDPALAVYLVAISLGAVFFGAATYIGNGPNLMVKSIAESSGVKMPGFGGYILRFSLPILAPVLIAVWLIFLM